MATLGVYPGQACRHISAGMSRTCPYSSCVKGRRPAGLAEERLGMGQHSCSSSVLWDLGAPALRGIEPPKAVLPRRTGIGVGLHHVTALRRREVRGYLHIPQARVSPAAPPCFSSWARRWCRSPSTVRGF